MSMHKKLQSNPMTAVALSLSAILAVAIVVAPQEGVARSAGPFANFSGNWRGVGEIVGADGKSESITCRARYDVSQAGAGLSQTLVCASDSYRFDIHSNVVADGESVKGDWQEATRNVSGNLNGSIQKGDFEGDVDGAGFTAQLSLRTSGRKQAVSIVPHGGDIGKVDIALTRGV
jgi:hypothetical protein